MFSEGLGLFWIISLPKFKKVKLLVTLSVIALIQWYLWNVWLCCLHALGQVINLIIRPFLITSWKKWMNNNNKKFQRILEISSLDGAFLAFSNCSVIPNKIPSQWFFGQQPWNFWQSWKFWGWRSFSSGPYLLPMVGRYE